MPYFQIYGELFLEEMREQTNCTNPEFTDCSGDPVSLCDSPCSIHCAETARHADTRTGRQAGRHIHSLAGCDSHLPTGLVCSPAPCRLHHGCQHPPRQPAHCHDELHLRGRRVACVGAVGVSEPRCPRRGAQLVDSPRTLQRRAQFVPRVSLVRAQIARCAAAGGGCASRRRERRCCP